MSHKRTHPLAGQITTIKQGPLKGNMYQVIDYMETQHQGKSIERIKSPLLFGVKNRGYALDSDVVFGKLLPSFGFFCVHDKELQSENKNGETVTPVPEGKNQPRLQKVEPDNVVPLTQSVRTKERDKKRNSGSMSFKESELKAADLKVIDGGKKDNTPKGDPNEGH